MIEATLTLLLVCLMCLAFPSTRSIGVVGIALLLLIHPLLLLGFAVLSGVVLYFIQQHRRSKT